MLTVNCILCVMVALVLNVFAELINTFLAFAFQLLLQLLNVFLLDGLYVHQIYL